MKRRIEHKDFPWVPAEALELHEQVLFNERNLFDPLAGKILTNNPPIVYQNLDDYNYFDWAGPPEEYRLYFVTTLGRLIVDTSLENWWTWLSDSFQLEEANLNKDRLEDDYHVMASPLIDFTIEEVIMLSYRAKKTQLNPSTGRSTTKLKRKLKDEFLQYSKELLPELVNYFDHAAREAVQKAIVEVDRVELSEYELLESGTSKPWIKFCAEIKHYCDRMFPESQPPLIRVSELASALSGEKITHQAMKPKKAK